RNDQRDASRPGSEIEYALRLDGNRVERGFDGGECFRRAALVPDGRELVELRPQRATKHAPEHRPADDHIRDEAGKALAGVHGMLRCSTSGCPARAENISAALPRLIATAMFLYASSKSTISPGRA